MWSVKTWTTEELNFIGSEERKSVENDFNSRCLTLDRIIIIIWIKRKRKYFDENQEKRENKTQSLWFFFICVILYLYFECASKENEHLFSKWLCVFSNPVWTVDSKDRPHQHCFVHRWFQPISKLNWIRPIKQNERSLNFRTKKVHLMKRVGFLLIISAFFLLCLLFLHCSVGLAYFFSRLSLSCFKLWRQKTLPKLHILFDCTRCWCC